MSNLSTLPKGDSAWLLRKAIERIIQQVSVLETNIGASTSGNSANTQIIFNDNGTLRGDAGLVYNKTTDALTVAGLVTAGSATITGAATVGTTLGVTGVSTLTGNAFANGSATVAGGTPGAFANAALTINNRGGVSDLSLIALGYRPNGTVLNGAAYIGFITTSGSGNVLGDLIFGTRSVTTDTAPTERYRIDSTGISTWSVAGTTAMTLNSTGLGIGAAPEGRLNVANTATPVIFSMTLVGAQRWQQIIDTTAGNWTLRDQTGSIDALIVKAGSGNLGVGVTPSAWASNYKSVQVNPGGGFAGKTDALLLAQNCYFDGTNWVNNRASTYSSRYDMNVAGNGIHAWYVYNASFGTVGNTIPFTQAMTLDASGRLGIGTATPATNLHIINDTAATNSAVDVLTITQSSTGTAAAGLGGGVLFKSERPSGGLILNRGAIYGVSGTDPDDDGDLAFYTLTDTGPSGFTEKVRINAIGNIVMKTVNTGIDFSINSDASATSELLNDYEEGTWQGTLTGNITTPASPIVRTGKYTKIGRQVSVTIYFEGVDTTGYSGAVAITGLPFTEDGSRAVGTAGFYNFDFNGGTGPIVDISGSTLGFLAQLTNSNWRDVLHSAGASRFLRATVTYFV